MAFVLFLLFGSFVSGILDSPGSFILIYFVSLGFLSLFSIHIRFVIPM